MKPSRTTMHADSVPWTRWAACFLALTPVSAWAQQPDETETARPPIRVRLAEWSADQDAPQASATTDVQPVGELRAQEMVDPKRVRWHVPDPEAFREYCQQQIEHPTELPVPEHWKAILERMETIRRRERVSLSLSEVIRRALAHSFAIRIDSYAPAISTTQVVEAEAAFDAVFFASVRKNKVDRPVPTQLQSGELDSVDIQGGVRKLLPSGMRAETSLSLNRTFQPFQFQTLNPSYGSQYIVQFTQPLARGFGLDFNRSRIVIARNNLRLSDELFHQRVRDTLNDVERAYWRLAQARRTLVVFARLVSGLQDLVTSMEKRVGFDVFEKELAQPQARLETAKAQFIRARTNVRDAEDQLIALMNDPGLDLADDVEIIPTDEPALQPIVVDRVAECQAALDHRSEIRDGRLRVDVAKIRVGQAKNQALPQLDLTFRYSVDGLGGSGDRAFDEVTKNNFQEYLIQVAFEVPIGNRGPRAALQRARLEHAQAIARLKNTFEQVLLDVNLRVRDLSSSYEEFVPNLESVVANATFVETSIARKERMDPNYINLEIGARNSLAVSRSTLLDSIVRYNIAIIDLERAKGTLLDYNNVVIEGTEPSDP